MRRERSPRIKWLDLHNLLGIVTLVWAFVVGVTGMINTWADLVIKLLAVRPAGAMIAPYKGQPTAAAERGSVQASLRRRAGARARHEARASSPFPGTAFSSPHHYTVFMRGTEPLTSRLLQAGAGRRADRAGHRPAATCPGT